MNSTDAESDNVLSSMSRVLNDASTPLDGLGAFPECAGKFDANEPGTPAADNWTAKPSLTSSDSGILLAFLVFPSSTVVPEDVTGKEECAEAADFRAKSSLRPRSSRSASPRTWDDDSKDTDL